MTLLFLLGHWSTRWIQRHLSYRLGDWLWHKLYDLYRETRRWKEKSALCIAFGGRRCARCPRRYRLEAHHRTYERVFRERLSDLEPLCYVCHASHHGRNR